MGRTLQQSEEAILPALSAVPVFKKQLSDFEHLLDTGGCRPIPPSHLEVHVLCFCLFALFKLPLRQSDDFKLSLSTLRTRGILPSGGDIQQQTEKLASQVSSVNEIGVFSIVFFLCTVLARQDMLVKGHI